MGKTPEKWKIGKLEKSKNNYNFLKLGPNVINCFLNVVKFDVALGNNYCKIAPSFIFFGIFFCVFETNLSNRKW